MEGSQGGLLGSQCGRGHQRGKRGLLCQNLGSTFFVLALVLCSQGIYKEGADLQ